MARLPPLRIPSSLLYDKGITPRVEDLKRECSRIHVKSRCRELRSLAQEAHELEAQGDSIGCAILLVHLGDRCLEIGRLGPAREYYTQARRLFHQKEFKAEHSHNEAVAIYGLGLIDQFLGNEKEALNQYDQAMTMFAQAQNHWRHVGSVNLDWECEQALTLIKKLREFLTQVMADGGTTALPYILGRDEEMSGPFIRDAEGRIWFIHRVRIIPDDM